MSPGDLLTDRSSLTPIEGDGDGCAILTDQWGVLYVTDESNQVQYVGHNALSAEAEYMLLQFGLGG